LQVTLHGTFPPELVISVLFASLQVLELDHNNLMWLSPSILQALANRTGLQRLTLHANPWHCDCSARGMLNFLQEHFTQVWIVHSTPTMMSHVYHHQQQWGRSHSRLVLPSWLLVSPSFSWLTYISSASWNVLIH
jgi:hypothetical protein